ncbi:PEGA domain-containing protein [Sorangium sp. So ce295]|uniref:PEGA domain-containing protein n=1 Tax=Sorangium sp. So ce295 TaxID=3133295 RepID=UPI003F608774
MLRTSTFLVTLAIAGCGGAPKPPPEPPRPAPIAAEPESEPEPPLDDAPMLDVIAAQPTEILLDGKPIGTTPISGRKVAPGSHEVTFVDPERGNRTMMVTLEPGDAKTVQSDPPPSLVEASGGATDDKQGETKK